MRHPILLLLAVLLCGSSAASATSCRPRSEEYYFICERQQCTPAFRVGQAWTYDLCGRRRVVTDVDPAVAARLRPILEASMVAQDDGVVAIGPFVPWRQPSDYGSVASVDRALADAVGGPNHDDDIDLETLLPGVVSGVLEYSKSGVDLRRAGTIAQSTALRRGLARTAFIELAGSVSYAWMFIGSAVAALAWLLVSTRDFFAILRRRRRFDEAMLGPLASQVLIAAAGISAVSSIHFSVWPGILLVPLTGLLLIVELLSIGVCAVERCIRAAPASTLPEVDG